MNPTITWRDASSGLPARPFPQRVERVQKAARALPCHSKKHKSRPQRILLAYSERHLEAIALAARIASENFRCNSKSCMRANVTRPSGSTPGGIFANSFSITLITFPINRKLRLLSARAERIGRSRDGAIKSLSAVSKSLLAVVIGRRDFPEPRRPSAKAMPPSLNWLWTAPICPAGAQIAPIAM